MIGRLLESLGLFVGGWKDPNHEALFFQRINEWLMAQCGARWDNPTPISGLWERTELVAWIEAYVRYLLDSPRAIQFLGIRHYLRYRGITSLDIARGWKDPRNTFTLPLWLRLFPEARVLYVERHGVDVAQSLKLRSERRHRVAVRTYRRWKFLHAARLKRGGFVDSPRCLSLEGAFGPWRDYVDEAARTLQALPPERVLKLRFENVLTDPQEHLARAAEFCQLYVCPTKVRDAIVAIDSGRAYPHRSRPELLAFARAHAPELRARGYEVGEDPEVAPRSEAGRTP